MKKEHNRNIQGHKNSFHDTKWRQTRINQPEKSEKFLSHKHNFLLAKLLLFCKKRIEKKTIFTKIAHFAREKFENVKNIIRQVFN